MSPELLDALTGLEPGRGLVRDDVSNADYHAGPGLSCSGAKRLLVTPYHYHALAQAREAPLKAPTPAMVNGTLTHCALLEPDDFSLRYVVGPDVDKRNKEWREFVKWAGEAGQEVITQLQRDTAWRQADALREVPAVAELLAEGHAEQSVYWRDAAHGLLLKCRPDWRTPVQHGRGVVLLDVKTAIDASPEGFSSACAKWAYHLQAAWYCEGVAAATGLEVHGMVFGVVEPEYPHAGASYMLSDEALQHGRELGAKARVMYRDCLERGEWPGYPQDIQVIDLPRWYRTGPTY